MRHILFGIIIIPILAFAIINQKSVPPERIALDPEPAETYLTITGIVKPKETLDTIFTKHHLNKIDLSKIVASARDMYDLSMISVGSIYSFELDADESRIQSMRYGINDESYLNVTRNADGFSAERVTQQLVKKTGSLVILIADNLSNSMPSNHREYHKLALKLSDIYAWDIDFTSDIRSGDRVKVVVEELWVGEVFRGFGNILAAEFINNGRMHEAYRFEDNHSADYFDRDGKSLRKALLRSPLKFKYVSSRFSRRRLHPILRTYRAHLGVDYAAPSGTPVSAAGSGTVLFAGYKGQNGRMVKIKHSGGFITYYGHLSRIPKKIRKGVKVSQGDLIGYVGKTGLASGPHLDYRIRQNGKFVNPLTIKLPRGTSVPSSSIAGFNKIVSDFELKLASIHDPRMDTRKPPDSSG